MTTVLGPAQIIMLDTWECHALSCTCAVCAPGHPNHALWSGASMPAQCLLVPLAADEGAPAGWRKVRKVGAA